MVDQLYANVDVSAQLQKLPAESPVSGRADCGSRAGGDRPGRARSCSGAPASRRSSSTAASLAQSPGRQGARRRHDSASPTTNGDVVLDLHPLVVQLGDRFGFLGMSPPPVATGRRAASRSCSRTSSTRHRASRSSSRRSRTGSGSRRSLLGQQRCGSCAARRRKEVRAIAIGLIVAGVALLVIRPGRRLVPRRQPHELRLGRALRSARSGRSSGLGWPRRRGSWSSSA